jgi:two-component system sensor histidine kinase DesK
LIVSTIVERIRGFRPLPSRRNLGWTPYAWLIYWPTLFIEPAMRHSSALVWAATSVVGAAFLVSYFRAYWLDDYGMLRIVALQVLLVLALAPMNGGAWVLFVYAAAFIGQTENTGRAVRLIGAVTAIGVAAAALSHIPLYYAATAVVITPLIGAINLHYSQLGRANAELHRARDDIEHLATVAERERIARDMHDVLGHTLSMIVLKAELASKLREAVTNIVRHSGAGRVTIRLTECGDDWQLEVLDDGRGGDDVDGSGLRGVRARVEAAGGTLFRRRDNGTRLTVRL